MNALNKTLLSTLIAASLGMAGAVSASDDDNSKMAYDNTDKAYDDTRTERTAGQAVDDATITASVKTKLLEDDRTEGFDINVDTRNGHVTLRGGADSMSDRSVAGDIALTTDGVVSVDNQITVAREGTEARTAANEATASGEVREAAGDAGEAMSDAWITSKVKTMLIADEDVAGLDINVDTKDKVVHLIGNVPNSRVRAEAIRIAETTEGVASVDAGRLNVRSEGAMR